MSTSEVGEKDALGSAEQVSEGAQGESETESYAQIVKASALIGGAQGIGILLGMVRTKGVAILIGPAGVGLLGNYQSIIGVFTTLAGLGVRDAGVRDVAQARGTEDEEALGRVVLTLKRACLVLGTVGALLMILLAGPLSVRTFGTAEHAGALRILGVVVFLGIVEGSYSALIQGARRIGDLARFSVLSVMIGTVVSLGFYAWLGLEGIVPAVCALALARVVLAHRFARRIPVSRPRTSWRQSFVLAGGLVRLGLALVWSGGLAAVSVYIVRTLVTSEHGLTGVGAYTAAMSLSMIFVQFILSAMGSDYYPRLTEAHRDSGRMRTIVNQQTEVGMLIAFPGLLMTLALAPWAIQIFYSSAFEGADILLRWFVLGCFGRILSWPLAYVILAKGRSFLYAATESLAIALQLFFVWGAMELFGLPGAAIGFFLGYVSYTVVLLVITRKMIAFSWSRDVWQLLVAVGIVASVVFFAVVMLDPWIASGGGALLSIGVGVFCARVISRRLGPEHRLCRMLAKLPLGGWLTGQR